MMEEANMPGKNGTGPDGKGPKNGSCGPKGWKNYPTTK